MGTYRLLIINGHKSYNSINFQDLYKEEKIITLYIPSYSSHLLQLLNIDCFLPLKRAYRGQISGLARSFINHIIKIKFLPAFKAAFFKVFIKENIYTSFQGARLIPFNPDTVLLKLNIKLRTLMPPILKDTP